MTTDARPQAVAELGGRIGVAGAVSMIVGYIIGGSIFILPVALTGRVGPAAFLAYLVAAAIALFVCVASAQIGSAFPMSGGTYVAVSRVISPFWGFMVVWMGILMVFTSTSALAYALVDYLTAYVPVLTSYRFVGAVTTIVVFTWVNLRGIRTAVWVQTAMVVVFMAALIVVGTAGLANASPSDFTPLFPLGPGEVLAAAVPAYYSYSGFSAIVNIGGEVRHPRRNIPLVLALSFPIILVTYTLVTLAVPAALPWQALSQGPATLTRVTAVLLPGWFSVCMGVAALCAIATSINGLLLSKSRDVFALAIDRVLPKPLATVGPFGEPRVALYAMGAAAVCGIALRRSFAEYASMAVLCVMVVHALQGFVVVLLPSRAPDHFASAGYRLGGFGRVAWGAGLAVCALAFIAIGLASDPFGGVIYLLACALGAVWYHARRVALRRAGLSIDDLLLAHAAAAIRRPAAAEPPRPAVAATSES